MMSGTSEQYVFQTAQEILDIFLEFFDLNNETFTHW